MSFFAVASYGGENPPLCEAKRGKNADPLAAVAFSHRSVLFISDGTPEMDEPRDLFAPSNSGVFAKLHLLLKEFSANIPPKTLLAFSEILTVGFVAHLRMT